MRNRSPGASRARIASIDQFRGYAILAMIFVNYVGRFDLTPWMLQHHREGMSFNDTIAPIFVFVVGMGFRLSVLRRIEEDGIHRARRAAAKRYVLLTLLGFLVYMGYFWDALTDIGIAGLLTLPIIHRRPGVRIIAAAISLALFQAAFSLTPYGAYAMNSSLNGGPLGPLSWAFILLLGSVAYDLMATRDSRKIVVGCLSWGIGLSLLGWLLRVEWPGIKAFWPFSQYGMSAPYPVYAAGLCFLTLLFFRLACDECNLRFPHLTLLGENPLVLYLVHGALLAVGEAILPDSASLPIVTVGFVVVYAICYATAYVLHRRGMIVKL